MQIILYLARSNKIVSSAELSESLQISQRYILQIARKLRDGEMIDTHIGMSGGYTLKKEASTVSVYDMVSLLEGEMHIPSCIIKYKNDTLHTTLSMSKKYIDTFFSSITLDQLLFACAEEQFLKIIRLAETHIGILENEKSNNKLC